MEMTGQITGHAFGKGNLHGGLAGPSSTPDRHHGPLIVNPEGTCSYEVAIRQDQAGSGVEAALC